MNIAGRTITRTDIVAAGVGSALGVALAVVPGLIDGGSPSLARSRGRKHPVTGHRGLRWRCADHRAVGDRLARGTRGR